MDTPRPLRDTETIGVFFYVPLRDLGASSVPSVVFVSLRNHHSTLVQVAGDKPGKV